MLTSRAGGSYAPPAGEPQQQPVPVPQQSLQQSPLIASSFHR